MKIAICARTWDEKGGIGVYTRTLISHLLRLDRENSYVIFYNNQSRIGQFAHLENVDEIFIPSRRFLGNEIATLIWDQLSVPRYARKHLVDVIFHTKFAVPLLTRRSTVMVLHGTERFFYPHFQESGDILFFKTVYPWYLRRATLILADCENGRRDIMEQLGINGEKIHTVHLAGDPAFRIVQDKHALKEVRERYRLPDRFLIFVGHIYPGKNVARLLKAFAKVRQHHDIKLVIVGSPRRKFKKDLALIDELGLSEHVHMPGFIPLDDLVVFYNLAEATVFPSIYECFPAIPLDANACGCPVVTSHTGGTPEAAGDAAEFVNPFNVQEIADAICRVLSDPKRRRDLIDKGFRNARRFSWEQTAEATLSALQALEKAETV